MRRLVLTLSLLALWPALAGAQVVREALIVFKDGFSVKGKPVQKRDFITDPVTGQSFVIPKDGSFLHLDDGVRRIFFSPFQVQEVVPSKQGETRKDLIQILRQQPSVRKNVILSNWVFEKATDWNDKWERTFTINTGRGTVEMRQRIIQLTPWQAYFMGVEYAMDQQFLTKELGPEFVLRLLYQWYGNQKDMKEVDKRLQIARFMQQAEWYGVALKELEQLVKEHSEAKAAADPIIEQLKRLRANLFVEDIERTHKIGQHEEAQGRITAFFQENLGKEAGQKQQIIAQDLKTKYETGKERLQQARQFLKDLPTRLSTTDRPFWAVAAATIAEELTIDTLPRLETFLTFAHQQQRELTEKRKLTQSTEEVLSIAVSGWLQGNNLAEPDVKNATKLFKARLMLQEYLKTDGNVGREKLAATFQREHDLPVDVIARVVRHMPPIVPYDQVSNEQLALDIEAPEASEGKYLVQLPPDYNPYRPYPVLVLLQSSRDKASDMMKRCQPGAAYHGYILAAPLWVGKGRDATYKYSAREHALVLDALRDLRRRFHVDSDRVFLFGWEDGAAMAFDVGLSHPDQFAGVLPMNGNCDKFPIRYLSNGQYLPFYVIDGDGNGPLPKLTQEKLIKPWMRGQHPSIYVEYKGRASEWYSMELPTMFEWMNKKKRHFPARELGVAGVRPGDGSEFKTSREFDNKFYWLATDSIDERNITDAADYKTSTRPALLQASIAVGNEAGGKTAKIWNQISIRTTGIKQVSVWLAPNMIDITKPVLIRVNGVQHGNPRVIPASLPTMLEEYFQSGDKERLFYAKVDLKL
jgi:pimeloyl-ACP methyl ester carboxylesterase